MPLFLTPQLVNINRSGLLVDLVSNVNNPSLSSLFQTAGWDGVSSTSFTIKVASGVDIGSSNRGTPAMDLSFIPVGSDVTLINEGRIAGAGGRGALLSYGNDNSEDGGTALYVRVLTTIDNTATGEIFGGGGGGGSGEAEGCIGGAGGGGGGGIVGGAGGAPGGPSGWGQAGTRDAGGAGGSGSGDTQGKAGGDPGEKGQEALGTNSTGHFHQSQYAGEAGNAIDGSSYCTFISGNNATHVKGSMIN